MRLANGIVIDKEATFGALKFSALRREVHLQNEDGSVSEEIKERTYVFSILLCVFYSVLNMSATALFDALPKTILWFLPTPLTTFWSAGDMAAHGIKMDLEQMTGLIPSTFQVVMILGIMAIISFWLIDRLYKQRGE